MNNVKAAIFDLDGTLYDKSRLPFRLVCSQLLKGKLSYLKKERTVRKQLKGLYFNNSEQFESVFFDKFGMNNAKEWFYGDYLPDMVHILRRHYTCDEETVSLMRDYHDKGVKTAVFSDYGFVEEKLQALGFDMTIADYLFDAPSLGGLKPCRESFLKICETLGVQPSECVMYGDREDTDGDGARAANMRFVKIGK